jgi:hypothetical protein
MELCLIPSRMELYLLLNSYLLLSQIPTNTNTLQPVLITATATLIGAFIGACVAQYFSHRLSIKREREKYYRDVFLNFFSPMILDITSYYDISTAFRRGHDIKDHIDEETIRHRIINQINLSLKFAPPNIIPNYAESKKFEYWEDFSGFYYQIHELELFASLLDGAKKTLNKSGISDPDLIKRLKKYHFHYLIWIFFTDRENGIENSNVIMSYDFYFNDKIPLYKKKYILLKIKAILSSNKSLFEKLISKNSEETVSRDMIKLLCKNKEDANDLITMYDHYQNRPLGYSTEIINTKSIIGIRVSVINVTYEIDTIFFSFKLQNTSDYIRNFSSNNFVLRKYHNEVFRCDLDKSFIGPQQSEITLLEAEEGIVDLQFIVGKSHEKELNFFSLWFIDENKSHEVLSSIFS